jgi:hypothetical protein
MVIWNPEDNINPESAYLVSHGPALSDVTESWGNLFELSANLEGDNISENYVDVTDSLESFHPYGMVSTPQGVWSISTVFNPLSDNPERDSINSSTFFINKAVFNSETNSFDWEVKEVVSGDWYRYDTDEDTFDENLVLTHSIGFSMDGQYGYAVVTGAETTNPQNAPLPVVWKSSDFGETWERLPYFEFADAEEFITYLIYNEEEQDGIKPFFTGFDLVVDNDGRLHMFADVVSGAAELAFSYTALETQGLFHCSTSDGTDWEVMRIAPLINDNTGEVGEIALGARPQMSISSDGEVLFFVWQEDDDLTYIEFPDAICVAHRVGSDYYTDPKKLTDDTDFQEFAFWPSIAPISITGGECFDYEIPLVLGEPSGDEGEPLQYYYLRCSGFDEDEIDNTVGVEESIALELSIYPNPAQESIRIDGLNNQEAEINVYDVQGKLVLQEQLLRGENLLRIEQLNAGNYFLEVVKGEKVWNSQLMKQ